MPAYRPSSAEIARENVLVNSPLWQSERGALVGLLRQLRSARGDSDYVAWQLSLLTRLRARQELVGEVRRHLAEVRRHRSALAAQQPKPVAELRAIQEQIERLEQQELLHRSHHRLLLDLGDAMAWRRLGYNRAAITTLGQGSVVGWLSDGRGWDAEVSAINQLWRDGVFALVNDATTCLRLGDLTCFFPDRVEIREVKAGGAADDDSPQMQRLSAAIALVNTGDAELDGERRVLVRSHRPYRTFLAHLPGLLTKARERPFALDCVSPSQVVVARSLTRPGGAVGVEESLVRERARWRDSDVVLHWGTTLRRMRDRKHQFTSMAPIALLPLAADDVTEVLLGSVDISTWVNVSALARDLVRRGYSSATAIAPPESGDGFLRVGLQRGSTLHELTVAPHVREIMSIELMTPATLAALVDASYDRLLRDPTTHPPPSLAVPSEEARVWDQILA